jgi:xanthine dehydrogenase molybdenum-binding subunit
MAMGKKTSRLYRFPSQFFGKNDLHPHDAERPLPRYGSPQIHGVTEFHIDLLASKLRMDPAELRMKNLVHPGDLDPTGAPPLGNARIRECLALGMERFRWKERFAGLSRNGRFRKG